MMKITAVTSARELAIAAGRYWKVDLGALVPSAEVVDSSSGIGSVLYGSARPLADLNFFESGWVEGVVGDVLFLGVWVDGVDDGLVGAEGDVEAVPLPVEVSVVV